MESQKIYHWSKKSQSIKLLYYNNYHTFYSPFKFIKLEHINNNRIQRKQNTIANKKCKTILQAQWPITHNPLLRSNLHSAKFICYLLFLLVFCFGFVVLMSCCFYCFVVSLFYYFALPFCSEVVLLFCVQGFSLNYGWNWGLLELVSLAWSINLFIT